MKKIIVLFLLVLFAIPLFATNYYFAASGSDANSGTISFPYKTPMRIYLSTGGVLPIPMTFNAGDSLLFKRGDTFAGQLIDTLRGSTGAPIVIGAYGTGANPIFYGDGRELVWTANAYGDPHVYWAATRGYAIFNTTFYQWVGGTFITSSNIQYRGSNSTTFKAFADTLAAHPGSFGYSLGHDTLFLCPYGNVTFPATRDSIRVYRYDNEIKGTSHDVVVRDIDLRNFCIGITAGYPNLTSSNITFRKLHTMNNLFGSLYMTWVTNGLIDTCNIDTCGGSSLYINTCTRCLIQWDSLINVVNHVDGIATTGDLCGYGLQGSPTNSFSTQNPTAGGNVVQFCYGRNVYNGVTDWYWNKYDTVRNCSFHGFSSCGSPMGVGNAFLNNVCIGNGSSNGWNLSQQGNGTTTVSGNIVDSISNYVAWISSNDSAAQGARIVLKNNYLRTVGANRTLLNYFTTSGIIADSNRMYGVTPNLTYNGTNYSSVASFSSASGNDVHSTLNTASMFPTSGDQQTYDIGYPLPLPCVATFYDASGNPVSGATATNTIASYPVGATGQTLSATSVTTGISGADSTVLTLGNQIGTYQVTVMNSGYAFSPITFNEYGIIGSGNSIVLISGSSQNLNVLSTLVIPVVAQVLDQYGHPVSGVTVTSSITGYPPYPNGETVYPASTTTNSSGYAYFYATTGRHAGTLTLAIASTGLTGSPLSATITIIKPTLSGTSNPIITHK